MASTFAGKPGLPMLLVLMAALCWLAGLSVVYAQQRPTHVFAGRAFVDSDPPPDRTTITAWIDGHEVAKSRLKGGNFTLFVEQPQGQSYAGRTVTYRVGEVQTGERRDWQRGGSTVVNLNAYVHQGRSRGQDRLPGRFIRECVLNALGRLPAGKEDMTAEEPNKANRLCPSLKGRAGALEGRSRSNRDQQRTSRGDRALQEDQQRLETDRIRREREFQAERQRLETERIKQERELQVEQQGLDAARMRREQERLKRDQIIQQEQDRLDRDRLKSERQRQQEQSRLDAERLNQDQDRIKAEKEFQLEQQRLDQRWARVEQQHQEELENARFESERARIGRERALEEDQARLDQERLKREQSLLRQEVELNLNRQRLDQARRQGQGRGGQPPVIRDQNQTPDGGPVEKSATRGFFTNSQIGQLGSVNRAVDPSTLAVIGIFITFIATSLQLF